MDCKIIAMILAIEHNQDETKLLIMSENQTTLEYCEYVKKKGKLAYHNKRLFKALRKFEGKIQGSYIMAHKGIEGRKGKRSGQKPEPTRTR